jgi:hypothetical protein
MQEGLEAVNSVCRKSLKLRQIKVLGDNAQMPLTGSS